MSSALIKNIIMNVLLFWLFDYCFCNFSLFYFNDLILKAIVVIIIFNYYCTISQSFNLYYALSITVSVKTYISINLVIFVIYKFSYADLCGPLRTFDSVDLASLSPIPSTIRKNPNTNNNEIIPVYFHLSTFKQDDADNYRDCTQY